MRRTVTLLAALAAALVLVPNGTSAQNPQTRDGFFIGFGLGGGSFGCEGCGSRETSVAGHFKLGGTINSRVLIGAESAGWTKDENGARLTHSTLLGIIQFYPSETSGFFVKGGVGISRLDVSVSGGGFSFSGGDSGAGFSGGLGYDVRVGTNFSITPYGLWAFGDHGGSVNTAQLGVGANWH
jgi:hypothetical protein